MANAFNSFSQMSYIPYRIIEHLVIKNENIWKLLKYGDYECLLKPNLTTDEKLELIWRGQSNTEDYHVFFTRLIEDAEPNSTTILKIYKYMTQPRNHIVSTISYEFDILYGGKLSIVDYNGIPCNRGEVFETELLKTLNGAEVNGVGVLQFNSQLTSVSKSAMNLGNNKTYTGSSVVMAVQLGSVSSNGCS